MLHISKKYEDDSQSRNALEQENHGMKVLGRIKGIGNNKATQDRHFHIASEMNAIIDAVHDIFHFSFSNYQRHEHYQLIGSTNSQIKDNIQKLVQVLYVRDTVFGETEIVHSNIKICVTRGDGKGFSKSRRGKETLSNFVKTGLVVRNQYGILSHEESSQPLD